MRGIYKITNKLTGQIYIGKSFYLEERVISHFNSLPETEMYFDIQTLGLHNFEWEILAVQNNHNDRELLKIETHYITKYRSVELGYNKVGQQNYPNKPKDNFNYLNKYNVLSEQHRVNEIRVTKHNLYDYYNQVHKIEYYGEIMNNSTNYVKTINKSNKYNRTKYSKSNYKDEYDIKNKQPVINKSDLIPDEYDIKNKQPVINKSDLIPDEYKPIFNITYIKNKYNIYM